MSPPLLNVSENKPSLTLHFLPKAHTYWQPNTNIGGDTPGQLF